MAKKSGANQRHNKSEEIRKTIKSGVTKPSEVQAKLAERGIQVSTQMVSTVKSKMVARRSARRIGAAAQAPIPVLRRPISRRWRDSSGRWKGSAVSPRPA